MRETKKVVPIIAVGILTFRLDSYWVIMNMQRTAVMVCSGSLLVFSNEVRAHTFMSTNKTHQDDYILEQFSWDNLVERFKQYSCALVDYRGKSGPKSRIPLKKEILYL